MNLLKIKKKIFFNKKNTMKKFFIYSAEKLNC